MAFVDHCLTAEDVLRNAQAIRARRKSTFAPRQTIKPQFPPIVPQKKESLPLWQSRPVKAKKSAHDASITEIKQAVCDAFKVKHSELISPRRYEYIVLARQVAFGLCKRFTTKSYPQIGQQFGGKDHSTIIHGTRGIQPIISIAASRLPDDATIDDWCVECCRVADEHPTLRPMYNCGRPNRFAKGFDARRHNQPGAGA